MISAASRFKKSNSPDDLPSVLTRDRIYILPTKQGLVFILALLVMLLIALNYNNNLAFLLTFLLGSILITSTIHTYKNLAELKILSLEAMPVFAGQQALCICSIDSQNYRRPSVEFSLSGAKQTNCVTLQPNQVNHVQLLFDAPRRGCLKLKRLTIASSYPFSFFKAWSNLRSASECMVYPKPLPGELPKDLAHISDNKKIKAKLSGAQDFQGLRAYQPGDSPRQIYWKALSRSSKLFTKIFQAEEGQALLLDFESLKGLDTEKRLSLLCHGVLQASRSNLPYALKLPGKAIAAASGDKQRQRCLEALARFGENKSE